MNRFFRTAQLIALNSVPAIGIVWAGWSNGTALALYWCENVLFLLFVALRIRLHRRATNKRGHYVEMRTSRDRGRTWKISIATYGSSFILIGAVFTFAEALFLGFAMFKLDWKVDTHALRQGLTATAIFLLFGFLLDLAQLRERPFAWIRTMADGALWRVFVIFITVMAGLFLTTFFNWPRAVFIVFAVLKLFTDIASQFPQYNPDEAPQWLVRAARATGLSDDFAQYWRTERREEDRHAREDEEPFDGRPSRTRAPVSASY